MKSTPFLSNSPEICYDTFVLSEGDPRGQHKDLVARDGVYHELYETQFSKALMTEENDGISELEKYMWAPSRRMSPDKYEPRDRFFVPGLICVLFSVLMVSF